MFPSTATSTAALLASLVATFTLANAFLVGPPPAEVLVSPAQAQFPAQVVVSSWTLSSQRALLEQASAYSSISSINLAATTATAPAPAPSTTSAAVKPPTPPASTPLASSATAAITGLNYDGRVPTTEADEYVVISNNSKAPVDVSGYYVYVATTGVQGPTFTFPKDSVIKPGGSVRIYTNEIHKETGGYSYGSGKAIWNNRGGLAVLKDSDGKKLGEYKYTPSS